MIIIMIIMNIYIYIHTHTYMYICIHTYILQTFIHSFMYSFINSFIHSFIHYRCTRARHNSIACYITLCYSSLNVIISYHIIVYYIILYYIIDARTRRTRAMPPALISAASRWRTRCQLLLLPLVLSLIATRFNSIFY